MSFLRTPYNPADPKRKRLVTFEFEQHFPLLMQLFGAAPTDQSTGVSGFDIYTEQIAEVLGIQRNELMCLNFESLGNLDTALPGSFKEYQLLEEYAETIEFEGVDFQTDIEESPLVYGVKVTIGDMILLRLFESDGQIVVYYTRTPF